MSPHIRPAQPAPVRERATCMCGFGGRCSSFAPGHALHLIQARLAAATPSDWADAIVVAVDPEARTVTVGDLDSGMTRTLWSGLGAAEAVAVGDPVAVHGRYQVLAVGATRWNVLPLD